MPVSILSCLWSKSDEDAMWRVKMHDDHAEFARLVKRWDQPIRRLCTRMTGDPHCGEDLKQETFLRLFEKRRQYEPKGRFSTWLWRIALNVCYDELRRRERRREFLREEDHDQDAELEEPAAEGPGPDARAAELEEGELVRQALLRLPETSRTVLVLRHYEGLKLARIAEVLEIPEGTVNSRMAEALARLSRILEPKLESSRHPPSPAKATEGRLPGLGSFSEGGKTPSCAKATEGRQNSKLIYEPSKT
jgi:RNA polymerase sigma-70 factor (ECF subfamily)